MIWNYMYHQFMRHTPAPASRGEKEHYRILSEGENNKNGESYQVQTANTLDAPLTEGQSTIIKCSICGWLGYSKDHLNVHKEKVHMYI